MYGLATSGIGVYGTSSTGRSGVFENTNAANTAATLFATSNGTGWAADFVSTNATTRALRTAGGLRFTGIGEAANNILTSDANGNATWLPPAPATDLVLPFDKTQAENGFLFRLINSGNSAPSSAIEGVTNSVSSSAYAIRGMVADVAPGGFSAAVRGVNNGTGGLGIGVWGSQGGSGWGVYGVTPNGLGVYGNSTAGGFGVFGNSVTGVGVYGTSSDGIGGNFVLTNNANNNDALQATTLGDGNAIFGSTSSTNSSVAAIRGVILSTAPGGFSAAVRGVNNGTGGLGIGVWGSQGGSGWGVYGVTPNGLGVYGNSTGTGFGVYGNSTDGIGVYGISSNNHASQFEIVNPSSTGDAVRAVQVGLGRGVYSAINNTSNIVAAVRGETNGGGYGIFGQATGNGNAGFFQISNPSSTSSTMNVTTNGIGSGVTVQLTNASNGARGVDVLQAGVGPGVFATSAGGNAVWGITSSISAAGVIGDNTFGEAVVGRNRGGNGVGAVVGRNDSTGYGVRGFNTKDGIGVLGQGGISGGTSRGGLFENVNAANPTTVLEARGNGTGASLVVANSNGGAVNLAIFRKGGSNVVRIADNGEIFANGGFTLGGADIAEYFEVEGTRTDYEEGDVLVISQSSDRKVEKSSAPYSTLISGVYATKPGVKLTERNASDDSFEDMIPMGVIGVVPTKVCLEGGAIKRGDLLVTSSIPGVAMKADPDKVKVGQVLGKALQDYNADGIGKINVLVSIK